MIGGRDITVEVDPGVSDGIEAPVELPPLLVGEVRNDIGVAPRLVTVRGVGEELPQREADGDRLRRAISALHFVIHDPAEGKFPLLVDLEVMSLLHEGVPRQERTEDEVGVDRGEVVEVRLHLAGHGIAGEVGRGKRVQEGAQRRLAQLIEGVLDRIALRSRQHGVFEDVGHAGRVGRRRAEGDDIPVLPVIAMEVEKLRAGAQVGRLVGRDPDLRERRDARDAEAVQLLAGAEGDRGGELLVAHEGILRILRWPNCFSADDRAS